MQPSRAHRPPATRLLTRAASPASFPASPAPKLLKFLPRERQTGAKTKLAANPAAARLKKTRKTPSAARLPPFPSQICLISARSLGSSTHLRRRSGLTHAPTDPRETYLPSSGRRFDREGKEARGAMDAAKSVTPGAVSHILAHPSTGSDGAVPDLVVQVLDLKSIGTGSRFRSVLTSSLPWPRWIYYLC